MLDHSIIKEKMAQIEQALGTQEMILKLLREGLMELKEQSIYYAVFEELRQIKKSMGIAHMEYPDEFDLLKQSIMDSLWPLSIDGGMVVESEPQKQHRAESIVQFVITDYLKDLKFLDFGCGEGHVPFAAAKQEPTLSVGYDRVENGWDRFEQTDTTYLTTDWDKIMSDGPYDVVLLFDVLDHAEGENPIEILGKVRRVLSPDGKVYVKCHPWCSRHGSHLYESGVNKAFAHLIFDDVELTRIFGKAGKLTLPVTHPIHTYHDWFADAEWEIDSEFISTTKVEKFFCKKELLDRIAKHYPQEEDIFEKYISIDFVDYVLKPKAYQVF